MTRVTQVLCLVAVAEIGVHCKSPIGHAMIWTAARKNGKKALSERRLAHADKLTKSVALCVGVYVCVCMCVCVCSAPPGGPP